ncbi:MAG: (d)CMP kinase [Alphaproteobacteria bacterium]
MLRRRVPGRAHAAPSRRAEGDGAKRLNSRALKTQIEERDRRDRERPIAPLKQAPDAHLLDTTALSIEGAATAARRIIDAAR